MKEEQIPEKATRSQLIVGGQGHRTRLDREQDVWFAVAELAKGKTYREIASAISEKKGYPIAFQQVYNDVQEVLIEWKRENMENIDAFIARECARLEEIERRVLADYEKSKLPRPNEYAALMKRGYTAEATHVILKRFSTCKSRGWTCSASARATMWLSIPSSTISSTTLTSPPCLILPTSCRILTGPI